MQGYQAGIQKFRESGNEVLGISMDNLDTLKKWGQSLNLTYPLLADPSGKVTEAYGVMMPNQRLAKRVTFVIDREGKIRYIEEGGSAVDTTGAMTACSRMEHDKAK